MSLAGSSERGLPSVICAVGLPGSVLEYITKAKGNRILQGELNVFSAEASKADLDRSPGAGLSQPRKMAGSLYPTPPRWVVGC